MTLLAQYIQHKDTIHIDCFLIMVFPSLAYNSELQNKLKSNFLNSKFVKVSKSDNKLFKTVIDSRHNLPR